MMLLLSGWHAEAACHEQRSLTTGFGFTIYNLLAFPSDGCEAVVTHYLRSTVRT